MIEDERLRLLDRLVQLDEQIMKATAAAAWPANNAEFESAMSDVRRLRAERAKIQTKLDASKSIAQDS
jgi:hypothetical protein